MKSNLLACIFALTVISSYAQRANTEPENKPSVENSIFSIETGLSEIALFGVWAGYEQRLGNQFTLKAEAGLNMMTPYSYRGRNGVTGINFAIRPTFTIEPRFYLIGRRAAKGKDITNNSGTYFALQTTYSPTVYQTHKEAQHPINQSFLTVIPSVGMRRNISKRFFMEGAVGLGFGYHRSDFQDSNEYHEDFIRAVNLHFRIGYRF